jgi:hypothetical protein
VQIQLVEYAILGVLAAVVGGALSIGGNALVAHFVFKMTPATPPLLILGAVATAAAVTVERAEMEGGMGWEVLLEMVGTPVQCTEYC